jgi:mediator of RNA polymerase II transcription subunit 18
MQPRHLVERRLIFKAYRKPGLITSRVGGSQDLQQSGDLQRVNKMLNGGMFYTQVVGPVSEADFSTPAPAADPDTQMEGMNESKSAAQGTSTYDYEQQPWKLEFRDIPEAGTRSAVTSRVMASASLPRGDIIPSMNAWGYRLVACFNLIIFY